MSKINIKILSDEALATIKGNLDKFTNIVKENPKSNKAILEALPENAFVEKRYEIDDFELRPAIKNYDEVDLENAILLYERLKDLPKHILGDERFWIWVILEKGYEAAIQAMPMESGKSIIKSHWLFSEGKRRSLMFGVLSRAFYRVALTKDDRLEDPYELTRFATENYERYRNFTWRTYSNNKKIVTATLHAEKKAIDKYGKKIESIKDYYTEIAKYVSQLGSVMLLDAMDEEFIIDKVEKFIDKRVEENSITDGGVLKTIGSIFKGA